MARKKLSLTRYVAFLRGINLGRRRVKMDHLRALFEELPFANVSTFIASGNVIFDAAETDTARLEQTIEAHLEKSLGYDVETYIRTPADLVTIAAFRPFAAEDDEASGHTVHVAFLRGALGEEHKRKLAEFRTAIDDFHLQGRDLYWLCRGRFTDSLVSWPRLAKAIGSSSTARNVTTIRKLVDLYPPA
jgi:uncharacterized protein (DUF1697 family)